MVRVSFYWFFDYIVDYIADYVADYIADYIVDYIVDYIADYIVGYIADYIADYICELSYATCTRINAVGTKFSSVLSTAVPVSGQIPVLRRSDGSFPQANYHWV